MSDLGVEGVEPSPPTDALKHEEEEFPARRLSELDACFPPELDAIAAEQFAREGSDDGSPQARMASEEPIWEPGGNEEAQLQLQQGQPMLPFNPPEAVHKWLRKEDWEALSIAWAEAEAKALEWVDSEVEGLDEAFWEDVSTQQGAPMLPSPSWQQGQGYQQDRRRKGRKRPDWDKDFNLLGSDSRKPPPLRRYFDHVPAETLPPTEAIRPGLRPQKVDERGKEDDCYEALLYGRGWLESHQQSASVDNDGLHPHLRHLFDRRGIESSYRQRPHIDHPCCQTLKPRTPGRPSDREINQKILSRSAATLPDPAENKQIHWGSRCLRYGPSPKVREGHQGEQIPWVYDHHRSESEDNPGMNPLVRHYFDADGLESSFRNRGRSYGRPVKSVFGRQFAQPLDPLLDAKHSKHSKSSKRSLAGVSTATGSATTSVLQASQSQPNLSQHV